MRIAIYTKDFVWAGGIDFLHGLVKGLLAQNEVECQIYILIYDSNLSIYQKFFYKGKRITRLCIEVLRQPSLFKRGLKKLRTRQSSEIPSYLNYSYVENVKEVFFKENVRFVYFNNSTNGKLRVLKKINADIVLPILNSLPPDFPIPWVGYLFDFVYKYHTHLYTKDFCLNTDITYIKTLLNAKTIIVNSQATYDDVFKFFPYAKSKVFTLPFAPYTNENIYVAALSNTEVSAKYNINTPFFMISNQFWLHKSHETAFEALAIVLKLHPKIKIVCTGKMTDLSGTENRKRQLEEIIAQLNLKDNILFLGHIPKVDQLSLMVRSVAVIQPTLFEGGPGGGAVYMAVANGVPAIVSDIPVNKEIVNEPLVTFFKAGDSKDLADKMVLALTIDRNNLSIEEISNKNKERLKQVGQTLLECINYTLTENRT